MKKTFKIIFFIFAAAIISLSVCVLFLNLYLSDVKLDDNKLVNLDRVITFYDDKGSVFAKESNGFAVTETENIPEYTKQAFISIEDKRFYSHKGVDSRAMLRATYNNLKSFSLKEGASTISQQLIKNTHLSGEKTIKRKLKEIKLTRILEKKYSKNEILEKYLNTIYFGNNCYGISSASKFYFDKSVSQLNINESAILAAIIKAPANYSPIENQQRCFDRKNLVLKEMYKQGYITEVEYSENKEKLVSVSENTQQKETRSYKQTYLIKQELNNILENNPYSSNNVEVYTYFNAQAQEVLENNMSDFSHLSVNKSAILMDKRGKVLAYYSDCGDVKRQLGSVLKPLAVYAPAIENDAVNSQTILSDKQTDFNGYCPSNFNEKYFGDISVKDSLAKSSNVCAVKILNAIDMKNSIKNLNKLGLSILDEDANLSLALGATKNGEKLSKITAAYNVFLNNGHHFDVKTVDKIKTKKSTIFATPNKTTRVFDNSTIGIMNDMLKNVVENGTAKKLTSTNLCLYAKTGTVGNKNGNTDAYIISYNSDYVLGVWFGAKNNQLMNNDVTGGTYPATFSAKFWKDFYSNKIAPSEIVNDGIVETYIDKISYEQDGKILIADEDTPERYKLKAIFKDSAVPKSYSTRFLEPKIETPKTLINNNIIEIKLCLTEFIEVLIYRTENGKKQLVFDSKEFGNNFTETLNYSSTIQYSIVPYFVGKNKTNYGKEIFLDKIKTPNKEFGDSWWENIFE